MTAPDISPQTLHEFREALQPLVGVQFDVLQIPATVLAGFEPSQIGTAVGTLMDGCIPQLDRLLPEDKAIGALGLTKHEGILGEREGYPDFLHVSGLRAELKGVYVDPVGVEMKRPPTRREPSARLTSKVTMQNVQPDRDTLLLVAHQLQPLRRDPSVYSPTVVAVEVLSMIECIRARDHRLIDSPGKWIEGMPVILSKTGKAALLREEPLDHTQYGTKANEGRHFNVDTNFGKMKRIPYRPLHEFLRRVGAAYMPKGEYPKSWTIEADGPTLFDRKSRSGEASGDGEEGESVAV